MNHKAQACHRLGCKNSDRLKGVRDRDGHVLLFCLECFDNLLRSGIIDSRTGKVLAT